MVVMFLLAFLVDLAEQKHYIIVILLLFVFYFILCILIYYIKLYIINLGNKNNKKLKYVMII